MAAKQRLSMVEWTEEDWLLLPQKALAEAWKDEDDEYWESFLR